MYSSRQSIKRNQASLMQQWGFSLIEIMFVMLIVGMIMSLVVVSIGDGNRGRKVQAQARTLFQGLQLAVEESVFYRRQLGVRFDLEPDIDFDLWRYTFMVYDADKRLWQLINTEELSEVYLLPGINLQLIIDDEEVLLGSIEKEQQRLFEIAENSKEEQRIEPDIYFLSSGETQNFSLKIRFSISLKSFETWGSS